MKVVATVVMLASLALGAERLALSQSDVAEKGASSVATFHNPLKSSGPDPWVIQKDGFFYYMNSTGSNLTIWKTKNIADLENAEKKVVWTPPATGPYSKELWAPELHFLDGKWYIYFAADEGNNENHRIYVVENASRDPLEGEWTFKGKLADASDKWAIDATVFEAQGKTFAVWSGWESDRNGVQGIYIARMKNPWTIEGPRVRLSVPDHPWEKVGDFDSKGKVLELPHVDVNEGPEILEHEGKVFLIYSASGCWTDYYSLGMLEASKSSDLMNAASWRKSDRPVLWQNPEGSAFGTGHNTFFKSLDGKQDWILYHANPQPNQGCGDHRSPRMQPFTWKPDGTPDFGRPIPLEQAIPVPSGSR
jgi:GH43 family beta-xylosidase